MSSRMRFISLVIFSLLTTPIFAQISGVITNQVSGEAIPHIPISITNEGTKDSSITYSDNLGIFYKEIKERGVYSIGISVEGYQSMRLNNISIISEQVKHLNIALIPKQYVIDEVVVTPSAWGIDKLNGISAFQINTHLMNLTVGSSYDIMRSATLIPGITNTSDASNDLNIRGNSPFGMSWYIEDVPVISPNHFTDNNSTNGVFSMFDSWGVNKSQLFISVFPIEYGNATSGVFNTELRTGNLHKFQGNFNISTVSAGGILESPIQKGKSSFIIGARYTFPDLIHKIFPAYSEKLGTVPDIFDSFFKLQSSINENIRLSLWGIGGKSKATFNYSGVYEDEVLLERKSKTISSGLSLNYNNNSFSLKTNLYTSYGDNFENISSRSITSSRSGWTGINAKMQKKKKNSNLLLGVDFRGRYYDQYRTIAEKADSIHTTLAFDYSTYLSYSYSFNNDLIIKGGVRYLYNGIADKHRVEPRIEINKQFPSLGNISFGFREHSTNTPIACHYTYEREEDNNGDLLIVRNKVNLPLMKSRHWVLGWEKKYKNNVHIGSEVFYQHLYDFFPIVLEEGYTYDPHSVSSFLGIAPSGPYTFTSGRNYGVELTVDVPFTSKKSYFYFAGTLFNSEFNYNEKWMSTMYNTNFSITSAFRKEIILNEKSRFAASLNYVLQGGRRYTPIDETLSDMYEKIVKDEDKINEEQYPNYSRLDASVSYTLASKKLSHSFIIEMQNAFNRKNVLERYELYGQDPIIINQVMRVFVYKYILHF